MKKNNIPEDVDFQAGILLALENAKKHFSVALVAKDISFGIANSHLILAIEEAAKADILERITINSEWLNHIDLDKWFSDHKYKHNESLKYLLADSFLVDFLKRVLDQDSTVDLKKVRFSDNQFFDLAENVRENTHEKLDSNKKWLKGANNQKNLGFYVNFNKVDGTWNGPFNITQEQFELSLEMVANYIEHTEKMIRLSQELNNQ